MEERKERHRSLERHVRLGWRKAVAERNNSSTPSPPKKIVGLASLPQALVSPGLRRKPRSLSGGSNSPASASPASLTRKFRPRAWSGSCAALPSECRIQPDQPRLLIRRSFSRSVSTRVWLRGTHALVGFRTTPSIHKAHRGSWRPQRLSSVPRRTACHRHPPLMPRVGREAPKPRDHRTGRRSAPGRNNRHRRG